LKRPLGKDLSSHLEFYRPPFSAEIPILYQEGVAIPVIINTNGDIYLLLTNAVGSEKGAEQNGEVLAIPGAQGQCSLWGLLILGNTPLLFISFILNISSNPVSDGLKAVLGWLVGRVTFIGRGDVL